jgi:hypothetical protein
LKQLKLFDVPAPAGTVSAWAALDEDQRDEVVTALARMIAKVPGTWAQPPGTEADREKSDE